MVVLVSLVTTGHDRVTLRHPVQASQKNEPSAGGLLGWSSGWFRRSECAFLQGFSSRRVRRGRRPDKTDSPLLQRCRDEGPGLPVLVMLIGGGARFRNIHFNVGGGTEQRTFDTSAYFDFGWHLLIRPVARRSPRPAVQAIAIQIDGGSGIGSRCRARGNRDLIANQHLALARDNSATSTRSTGCRWVGSSVSAATCSASISTRCSRRRGSSTSDSGPAVAYDIVPELLRLPRDFGLRVPFFLGGLEDAYGNGQLRGRPGRGDHVRRPAREPGSPTRSDSSGSTTTCVSRAPTRTSPQWATGPRAPITHSPFSFYSAGPCSRPGRYPRPTEGNRRGRRGREPHP